MWGIIWLACHSTVLGHRSYEPAGLGRQAVLPVGTLVAPLAGGSASRTHRDGFARYRHRGGRSCIGNAPRLSLQQGHAHLRETVSVAHALATLSLSY